MLYCYQNYLSFKVMLIQKSSKADNLQEQDKLLTNLYFNFSSGHFYKLVVAYQIYKGAITIKNLISCTTKPLETLWSLYIFGLC